MQKNSKIGLFVTCLIDNMRPDLGFSILSLLEQQGFDVEVPAQTCCGQPNYNGGDRVAAQKIAKSVIDSMSQYEYVVVPSGSCGGMMKYDYIELLKDDSDYAEKAETFNAKVYELSCFLIEIAKWQPSQTEKSNTTGSSKVTYHDACAGLRQMGVKEQPRTLLQRADIDIVEMSEAETCCGFGGAFCVKYPDVSNAILEKKIADIVATGADAVVAGDLGCLMNIEGKIQRQGKVIPVYHYAELLT